MTTADEVKFAIVVIIEVLSVSLFLLLAWKSSPWWLNRVGSVAPDQLTRRRLV